MSGHSPVSSSSSEPLGPLGPPEPRCPPGIPTCWPNWAEVASGLCCSPKRRPASTPRPVQGVDGAATSEAVLFPLFSDSMASNAALLSASTSLDAKPSFDEIEPSDLEGVVESGLLCFALGLIWRLCSTCRRCCHCGAWVGWRALSCSNAGRIDAIFVSAASS